MSTITTHVKPEGQSWVITMTPEMAEAAGVAEGSQVIFYFVGHASVAAEILPAASDELRDEVRQTVDELGEAFAEMKRRGD